MDMVEADSFAPGLSFRNTGIDLVVLSAQVFSSKATWWNLGSGIIEIAQALIVQSGCG
jgi:hypothetical protein